VADPQSRYVIGVYALGVLGLIFAVVIVLGEALGGPGPRRVYWLVGGAGLGLILMVYGFILLLLRKLAIAGPRRAEAEDDLRGRWTKPVP